MKFSPPCLGIHGTRGRTQWQDIFNGPTSNVILSYTYPHNHNLVYYSCITEISNWGVVGFVLGGLFVGFFFCKIIFVVAKKTPTYK